MIRSLLEDQQQVPPGNGSLRVAASPSADKRLSQGTSVGASDKQIGGCCREQAAADPPMNHHHHLESPVRTAATVQSEQEYCTTTPVVAGGGGGKVMNNVRLEWPRIYISLSRKEKEEDFFAMKGTKLPQRPKKRPKNIDKALQFCFPGMWLSDLTRGRYEVREKKCVNLKKQKRRGLKGMESVESDSE